MLAPLITTGTAPEAVNVTSGVVKLPCGFATTLTLFTLTTVSFGVIVPAFGANVL